MAKIGMIERGFTEREFDEEFTLETLHQLGTYTEAQNKVAEARSKDAKRR